MKTQLSSAQIRELKKTYQDSNSPEASSIETAISFLEKNNGNFETSFQELWTEQVGFPKTFNSSDVSLWQVTQRVIREEVCGDDGFRVRLSDYNRNPGSATLLTGAIVYLVGLTTLPINPAIATIIVLYIVKVGLNIFCEYTEPVD